ncbi:MAG: polysaccharide deacetylase family protein [Bacteroidetes bacterium]|nr:polysaccharide deacetylase family protein [Bacteroidota bacterium]MBP6403400.1 polysaccharide deacetylase family protein [Bacteroidia bacterium]MBK6837193.1 polysaccharide deacetylase family protein [Bacteroidota bacterium]MBK9541154.1 polysaccharide deacetylase family protein [Bacteroidota bacterium]MBL0258969.1 polysaccharide deacetylase family protein [Bacteroidota bacterium]
MLLIYSPTNGPRLRYTFDLIFRELLGIDYSITNKVDEFNFHQSAKLNYSESPFGDELFIYDTGFLAQRGIRDQQLAVFDWMDTKAFFATHPKYVLPFDPFAAAFYMVSRYEEYLPHKRDEHDRFDAHESLAYQKGFLLKPVVNIYANKLKEIISAHYPELKFPEKKYRYLSTIDIDNAWAHREKGLMRTTGAILRSFSQFNFKDILDRLAVLAGRKQDPYDTYENLFRIQQQYDLKCIYFFLLGDYGINDKNVSVSRKEFQSLIKSIADYNEVGIHPSYSSNAQPDRVRLEQSRLRKVIRRDVTKSRQHFLKVQFPGTYRHLIDCDISDDYTMGYASEIGFRAGICSSFLFYDLDNEQSTSLRIHPFVVMDATLRFYMKIQPAEVFSYISPLVREVKAVNGTFISIWHNETISNKKPWEGWQDVYEEVVKIAHA